MTKKEVLNNNKDELPVEAKDKDSVMGDDVLSDLESEGTQPEEVSSIVKITNSLNTSVNSNLCTILPLILFYAT